MKNSILFVIAGILLMSAIAMLVIGLSSEDESLRMILIGAAILDGMVAVGLGAWAIIRGGYQDR